MADVDGIAGEKLISLIQRIERLDEDKANIANDIREVYAEAKSLGFDTKIMRQLVKLRKIEDHDRKEQDELLNTYKTAIGMD